jgi:two-component system, response regulator YesN
MAYKAFLVEDEIVTREGIRDNVDWRASGFEFCGEAPDGEMALPLLQAAQPDVLITDIKMPFMDGLQLCKVVRERWPRMKVVILSGHDEFEYAQQAVHLGVTEYLLKPITVQDMAGMLQRVASLLDQDKKDQENLQKLHDQVEENRAVLREQLLLKLVVGAMTTAEAIEKGRPLGLELVARYYLVVIIKMELADRSDQFDYATYQQAQQQVARLAENNPDAFLLKKDWAELVLLLKGSTPEYLEEERDLFLERAQRMLDGTAYRLAIGAGTPKNRIADIHQSFVEALVEVQNAAPPGRAEPESVVDKTDLLKVDKAAVENYLRCGTKEEFDKFFEAFVQPVGETALKSYLLKNYLLVDVIVATAQFVHELGGAIDEVVPGLAAVQTLLANTQTVEQLRAQVREILLGALVFRDQLNHPYASLIRQAKDYIDRHYADPELALNEVAAHVNHSASHFSALFSQETCQTFKDYLTAVRIKKAKELLRTSTLKSAEIAYQVGYSDPHYFSAAFRKNTGLSPTEFRQQAQTG